MGKGPSRGAQWCLARCCPSRPTYGRPGCRFDGWIERYTSRLEGRALDMAQFNVEGRVLAEELKRIVGFSVEVVFQSEREDGSLGVEEVV